MIILQAFKILKAPSGYPRLLFHRTLHTWKGEEITDLEFDIFNPEEWRKYLRTSFRMSNGKKIPKKSIEGEELRFQVMVWGVEVWMKEHLGLDRSLRTNHYSLFPGYGKKGEKLSFLEYGWI